MLKLDINKVIKVFRPSDGKLYKLWQIASPTM